MRKQMPVALKCCGTLLEVIFDERTQPVLPQGRYRKSVSCPRCATQLTLSLDDTGDAPAVEQEDDGQEGPARGGAGA